MVVTSGMVAAAQSQDISALWKEFAKTGDSELRTQLILHYVHLVKSIVYRMLPTYKKHVDVDDLMSFGVLGLMDAVDRFDVSKQVRFETYASLRIRGEIIDQLRRQDWAPASLRQKLKKVEDGFAELEGRLGRSASDAEVAEHLSMDVGDVRQALDDAHTFNVVRLDEVLMDRFQSEELLVSGQDSPEQRYESAELREQLARSVESLSEKERLVITMYYFEEMNLKEIGLVLGVSESRVSQLHSKALMGLRRRLSNQ